jgi:hypothetical protein
VFVKSPNFWDVTLFSHRKSTTVLEERGVAVPGSKPPVGSHLVDVVLSCVAPMSCCRSAELVVVSPLRGDQPLNLKFFLAGVSGLTSQEQLTTSQLIQIYCTSTNYFCFTYFTLLK